MPGSSDPDLAAMKARYELNYRLIDSDPKLASSPIVIAALATAKASEAAFYAATKDVETQRNFFPTVELVSALSPSRHSRREGPR